MDLRSAQVAFFDKFAHLYDSGVPLAEALELAGRDLPGPMGAAVAAIVEDLYRGTSLADAMAARDEVFGAEVLGVIRAGETRGELGEAARSAARGLEGRVLETAAATDAEIDGVLERARGTATLHVDPDGTLRARREEDLVAIGGLAPAQARALVAGLVRRAGVRRSVGAFLWADHLVRVATAESPDGPAAVVRISAPPGEEPSEAEAWRRGAPGLLLVCGGRHADVDSVLRAVLRGCEPTTKRVAVGLPAPEALLAPDLDAALALDPDVICVARIRTAEECRRLVAAADQGVHTVAAAESAALGQGIPHRRVEIGT